MTCFATNVDLVECGVVRIGIDIETLLKIRRMAIRTHVVPALRDTRPVQLVVRLQLLAYVGRR